MPRKNFAQEQFQASLIALFFLALPSVVTKWAEVGALLASIDLVNLYLGSLVGLPAVSQLARLLHHWHT